MKTIQANDVQSAFKVLRIRPIQDQLIKFEGRQVIGCCGLTVLAITDPNLCITMTDLDGMSYEDAHSQLAKCLDLDEVYAKGFMKGWDGLGSGNGDDDREIRGENDGRAAWLLVGDEDDDDEDDDDDEEWQDEDEDDDDDDDDDDALCPGCGLSGR